MIDNPNKTYGHGEDRVHNSARGAEAEGAGGASAQQGVGV